MAEVDEVADFDPATSQGRSNSRARSLSASRRPSKGDAQILGVRTVTPPLQNVDLNVGQFPAGSRISGRRPSLPKQHGSGPHAQSFQSHQGLQGSHISGGDGKRDRQLSSERTTFEALKARGAVPGDGTGIKAERTRTLSINGQCAQRNASPKADSRRKPSRAGLNATQTQMKAEPSLKSLEATLSKLEQDKERSQGHAVQCKRALDKLGILGALMMPAGGRQVACKNALDKAISNALNAVDDLAVTGAAGLSPKGTGPVSPKGAGTGSPRAQGSRKGRETDAAEDMSAMGLSVQRISTAKAAESSSDTAEMAAEPPEQDQHEGEEELPAESGSGDEFDVAEEELLHEDHLRSIRRLMYILRLWSGSKASTKSGSGEELEVTEPSADTGAEDGEMPVQQVFDVVARVKARSGAMLCSQRSFENLLEILQKVDKAGGSKAYKKIPLSKVREAYGEQISLQISMSSRYGLSAAEASKGMVYETFRTCMHRLFYRPLDTEDKVKHLLLQTKSTF